MSSNSMKGNLSFVEQSNQELTGDSEETRRFLSRHLLCGGCKRHSLSVGEILHDPKHEPVEVFRQLDPVDSRASGHTSTSGKDLAQFSDSRLVGFRKDGRFESGWHIVQPLQPQPWYLLTSNLGKLALPAFGGKGFT